MKTVKKVIVIFFKWGIPSLLVVGFVAMRLIAAWMHYTDEEICESLMDADVPCKVGYIESQDYRVRTAHMSKEKKETLLIACHGAPGSLDFFFPYMKDEALLEAVDIISYDRPGYGASGLGMALSGLSEQAQVIEDIKKKYVYDSYVLLGHSYGGPIVVEHALNHPEKIDQIVLVCPAIDPYSEKYFWFSPIAYWPWTRWYVPDAFKVAGVEKYSHEAELRKLESKMPELRVPLLYIQGEQDAIAPARGNIAYIRSMVPDALLKMKLYPEGGHLIIWNDVNNITKDMLSVIR